MSIHPQPFYKIDIPVISDTSIPHDERYETVYSHDTIQIDPVYSNSSLASRRAVTRIAYYFRREFRFDAVQYSEANEEPSDVAFLWHKADWISKRHEFGRLPLGACVFRWREWTDAPHGWALVWIWLHPFIRRQGHLTAIWTSFKEWFGEDFHVEGPLSDAMETFIKSRTPQET